MKTKQLFCILLASMVLCLFLTGCDFMSEDDDGGGNSSTEIEVIQWDSSPYDSSIDTTAYAKLKGVWKLVSRTSTVFNETISPDELELMVFRDDKSCAFYLGDDMTMCNVIGVKELTSTEITRFWNISPIVQTNCGTETYELSNNNSTLTFTKEGFITVYEKSDKIPVSALIAVQNDSDYFSYWVDVENNTGYLCYRNQSDITSKKIRAWTSEGATVTVSGNSDLLDLSSAVDLTVTKNGTSSQLTVKAITLSPDTENMLPNGDFSMGMHFYRFGDYDFGAIGSTYQVSDGVFSVSKKYSIEQSWSSKLHCPGCPSLTLVKGKKYQLSFDAWASEPTTFFYKVGEYGRDLNNNNNIWDNYCAATVNLTTSKKTFSETFNQEVDDDYAEFALFMGNSDKTLYVDNIVLKEVE